MYAAMSNNNHIYPAILLLIGLLLLNLEISGAQPVGVCYGTNGDNLPPPEEVVKLYKYYGIKTMRIYDPNTEILQALRGSDIELVVGILNQNLQPIAENQAAADQWVQTNIINFSPDVNFRYIIVGNEVDPTKPDTSQYVNFLLPAMQNIQNALNAKQVMIKVTTSTHSGVIATPYPPSNGTFSDVARPHMESIIRFLAGNGAPLFVSVYPYLSYIATPGMKLEYMLFTSADVEVHDGLLEYRNLFDALLDAFYSAVEKVEVGRLEKVDEGDESGHLKVAETGVPTCECPKLMDSKKANNLITQNTRAEEVTTVENARIYNNNLIKHLNSMVGTPKRPGMAIEAYLFAMFDENLKGGDGLEQSFGLFTHDGNPKYTISFT